MNISAITFMGKPSGIKPTNNSNIKKMWKEGLPTNRYNTSQDRKALMQEIEFYRELLKENPGNSIYMQVVEEAIKELKKISK